MNQYIKMVDELEDSAQKLAIRNGNMHGGKWQSKLPMK